MARRIFIGFFILLVLVISIFLLYRSGFREDQIDFKIEGPEETVAGEEIEYKVIIENKNNFSLDDIKLSFFYSENSIPLNQDGQPLGSLVSNLDLDNLESRGKKEVVFKTALSGERGEIKKAKAILTYTPSNIRSTFQKNAEIATSILKTPIPLTLSGPPNVLSGQKVEVTLDLRNETNKDLENLLVLFTYPDGFKFARSNPLVSEGNDLFILSFLKAGEGARITIEGEISGFEKEGKRFAVVLRKKFGDKYFDFQKTETLLNISTPLLTTEVLVQGERTASLDDLKNYIAQAGDRLNYKIKFSNNSDDNFSALELTAKIEGQMFDLATIKTNGFFDSNTRTILWNAAASPLLSNLGPNQGGEVFFEVGLKNEFPKVFTKNYSLKVSSLIQTFSVPPDFHLDKISAMADLVIRVKSKTNFTSEAFYNDSVFSNSGPVPPRVGQKTTYTIHWKIINEGNDLTNVRITSSLFPGISWENKTKIIPTQSDLDYNPSTGRISWIIPTVPAGSGAVSPAFEAVFQIGVTPGLNQVSQSAQIMKEVEFEAVDNWTKEGTEFNLTGISSSTISDSSGAIQP